MPYKYMANTWLVNQAELTAKSSDGRTAGVRLRSAGRPKVLLIPCKLQVVSRIVNHLQHIACKLQQLTSRQVPDAAEARAFQ